MKKLFLTLGLLLLTSFAFCEPKFVGSENNKDYWYDYNDRVTYCCQKSQLPYEVLKGATENFFVTAKRYFYDNDEELLASLNNMADLPYEAKLVLNMLNKGYNIVHFNLPYSYVEEYVTCVAITDGEIVSLYWLALEE